MTKRTYQTFSKEFKLEAVRLADASDKPITQVARELGIRVNQIHKWKQQLVTKAPDEVFPGSGRQTGKDAELRALQRENERLKQENDILKKAAAYFAKQL